MKKNLISLIVLVLVFANLALTAILTITVLPEAKKANELVSKVCAAIDLDLEGGPVEGAVTSSVSMADLATYDIPSNSEEKMTIPLKDGGDGEDHFAVVAITLSMDSKHEDYKEFGSEKALAEKESVIKGTINDVISQYTVDEMKNNQTEVKDAVLASLQSLFGSTFITGVNFSSIVVQ